MAANTPGGQEFKRPMGRSALLAGELRRTEGSKEEAVVAPKPSGRGRALLASLAARYIYLLM